MDRRDIERIARDEIIKDFPEFADVPPHIEEREMVISDSTYEKARMRPRKPTKVWVAVFRKYFKTEDGQEIEKVIRATIDSKGKVIKITHSH